MAEVAPGIYVSSYVPAGTAFVLDLGTFMPAMSPRRQLGVNPADWERLDPAKREQLADTVTREHAEAGQRQLEAWLADTGRGED